MSSVSVATLKTYFNTGDKPTEANFIDVFDSMLNLADGGTVAGTVTLSNGLNPASVPALTAGTDIADSTGALAITTSDLGKSFICLLDGAAKTVTLPVVTAAHIGGTIMIIQGANLVGSGVLTLHLDGSGTFGTNSLYSGMSGGDDLQILATRPAAANNTITITGAATNSAWGIGSYIMLTVQAADEWVFYSEARAIGNGSNALAYSTA